ncbi:hypothetical protein CROQUDRAFT_37560 [Cronartium quercuum f. sp. fusiforme G11]|uniref:Uncharacterized protein n=1 Tax=Cronartium quercuum f. sp. fusiforme G11 TaxID=708437 RepID=A0A9P6TFR0_9BASI|nr:hypothetical protein CROQUDRAFT_37560 [Cronartium quercuum f. sp. fusiforme G11]
MPPSSSIEFSDSAEADLWGSDDGNGAQGEPGVEVDDDPTASILNLPDDCPSAPTSSLPPTTLKRHPPTFQGAFSQARVQQPMMRSFTDAFNQHLPSLFPTRPALPARAAGSDTGSISPRPEHLGFGLLNAAALSASGIRDEYPEALGEAAARFLEDFVASSSPHPAQQPDMDAQASVDTQFGPSPHNMEDDGTESIEEVLAQFSSSLTESPIEILDLNHWLPEAQFSGDSDQPSSSASAFTATFSTAGPMIPLALEADSLPASHEHRRTSTEASSSSSATCHPNPLPKLNPSATTIRSKPPGLFLPPRAPRLANDGRYSQTPFNSPITSGTSTPVVAYQPLTRVSRPPRPVASQGKTDQSGMLSSLSNKRKATGPPAQHPASVAERRLSTIHDTLMQASATNGRIGTFDRRPSSGLPRRAELDQVRLLRQIRELRRSEGSSPTTLERLEQEWEALLRRSDGIEAAAELKRKATEHCSHLRRMKDVLGGELVRVQIEESVLRHVRGIIAVRMFFLFFLRSSQACSAKLESELILFGFIGSENSI